VALFTLDLQQQQQQQQCNQSIGGGGGGGRCKTIEPIKRGVARMTNPVTEQASDARALATNPPRGLTALQVSTYRYIFPRWDDLMVPRPRSEAWDNPVPVGVNLSTSGLFISLVSPHLISSQLTSLSAPWLAAATQARSLHSARPSSPWLRPLTAHSVQIIALSIFTRRP